MKLAENTIKKWSTWANLIAMTLAGIMVYLPDVIPDSYAPKVMLVCTLVVKVAQWCKQENLEKVVDVVED